MDKNTIWAILLSTIVVIVSTVVEFTVVMPRQQQKMQAQAAEAQAMEAEKAALAEEQSRLISATLSGDEKKSDKSESENIAIQEYTITTDKVKVVFTNKGGDIVSYQLLEHEDKDTGLGVEMVDNVTDYNRALALSFGSAESSVLNARLVALISVI